MQSKVRKVSIPSKREGGSQDPNGDENLNNFTFQFPSNGKADRKRWGPPTKSKTVSSFNSLQTGRRIARLLYEIQLPDMPSFNSLQTGRRIASSCDWCLIIFSVSFQFPSNGKAYRKCGHRFRRGEFFCFNSLQTGRRIASTITLFIEEETVFQFPSNGKADRKVALDYLAVGIDPEVSIPFKREGGSQVQLTESWQSLIDMFQFPSNGKADRKPH